VDHGDRMAERGLALDEQPAVRERVGRDVQDPPSRACTRRSRS
jgi:hypothetical protein